MKSHSDLLNLIQIHAISRRSAQLHAISLAFAQIHKISLSSVQIHAVLLKSIKIPADALINTASLQVLPASLRLIQTHYALLRVGQIRPN